MKALLSKPLHLLTVALLAAQIIGCNSSSRTAELPVRQSVAERLQVALDQAVADGLPAVAISVKGDNLDFNGVAGVEVLESMVPLSANHRFYLASVGKTYTAVAIVKMAADGLLGLDDPITRWLPRSIADGIPSSDRITVRHLLNHTSGIFDYQDDSTDWLFNAFLPDPNRHWSNVDVLPYFLGRPLHFEPGTSARYADSNYVLLGLIAEAASGLPVQDIVRNYALAPLGLQDTLHGYEANGVPNLAHGYVELEGSLLDVYPWYSHYGVSDGGIQASAADVASFVHAIFTSESVLTNAMRAELVTPSGAGDPPSATALGVDVANVSTPTVSIYWNAGQDAGTRTEFHHLQSSGNDLTIVFCASASLGDYEDLFQRLKLSVQDILLDVDLLQVSLP